MQDSSRRERNKTSSSLHCIMLFKLQFKLKNKQSLMQKQSKRQCRSAVVCVQTANAGVMQCACACEAETNVLYYAAVCEAQHARRHMLSHMS